MIDNLIKSKGTSVVYSHLGKRQIKSMGNAQHIPDNTREALRYLSTKFKKKELMLSSVSEMLDYLVISEKIEADAKSNRINLVSDGIRYKKLHQSDLTLKGFSSRSKGFNPKSVEVRIDGQTTKCRVKENTADIFSIYFGDK